MLERALEFLGLDPGFTEEELKSRFYLLSKKYHPDTGEFSSDSLFKELIESRDVLHSYLEQKKMQKENLVSHSSRSHFQKTEYDVYKLARDSYDFAIHEYYKTTDGNPIFLKGEENPALRKLRSSLLNSKALFEELIRSFPESIWIADAKNVLQKIEVWFKEP
ncbi:J domain-containing protein [Leptospira sp. 201903070]|uniref:J domain-containing protein n=1 Tax=Leptospira ainlahdjerensis TaxID=2810033 RepID=A0ABS2U8W9_9LEPT|nr:J domain-containing protein [Leptospira ainlahdjerensis]MBM9575687.1 J domain-containing protein [Leptospira ainlahdjerensis]